MEFRQLAIGQEQRGQAGRGQERRRVRRSERGRGIGYRRALALVKLGPGGLASPIVFASAKRALVKRARRASRSTPESQTIEGSEAAKVLSRWRSSPRLARVAADSAAADSRNDRQGWAKEPRPLPSRTPREVSWSRLIPMRVMKACFRERSWEESSAWHQAWRRG